MHVTLIGMSNIGKSHWSRRLAEEAGFHRIDCDTLVERKLAPELAAGGYEGIHEVARWMGQPYDAQYPESSRKYIACERAVMLETIETLRAADPDTNPCVVDTTGSVIYTGEDIVEELKSLTDVIYMAASPQHVDRLFRNYIAVPKPVIWGDVFSRVEGETNEDALERCYAALLSSRARLYERMAEVIVPFEQHTAGNADTRSVFGFGDKMKAAV